MLSVFSFIPYAVICFDSAIRQLGDLIAYLALICVQNRPVVGWHKSAVHEVACYPHNGGQEWYLSRRQLRKQDTFISSASKCHSEFYHRPFA